MKAGDFYGSKTLSADDVGPKGIVAEIADVDVEEFEENGKDRRKLVLTLKDQDKRFVLNATNSGIITEAISDETDDWIGASIHIGKHKVTFGKKKVDGLTIREVILPAGSDPKEGE